MMDAVQVGECFAVAFAETRDEISIGHVPGHAQGHAPNLHHSVRRYCHGNGVQFQNLSVLT